MTFHNGNKIMDMEMANFVSQLANFGNQKTQMNTTSKSLKKAKNEPKAIKKVIQEPKLEQ